MTPDTRQMILDLYKEELNKRSTIKGYKPMSMCKLARQVKQPTRVVAQIIKEHYFS